MTTTWTIAIDWDRSGDFNGTYDNVTERVTETDWYLGQRKLYQVAADDSTLNLTLDNSDKRYSPENGSSPLFGSLVPFRPVRIQSYNGSTTRTHWAGWIESIQPSVNQYGERIVKIKGSAAGQFYSATETDIALQENKRPDEIIALLLQAVVIPPPLEKVWVLGRPGNSELDTSTKLPDTQAFGTLDTAIRTLAYAADNWIKRDAQPDAPQELFNVYRAIRDVTAAERGRFLFDREGRALFWNRHHLLDDDTVQVTLNNSMTGLSYNYGAQDVFHNEVIVRCHPREVSVGANELLWELDEPVKVDPGKDRTIKAKYRDDSENRIGGKEVVLDSYTFEKGSATILITPRASIAELKIVNSSTREEAVLSTAVVRGRKITDFGTQEATAQDYSSQTDYGKRTLTLNLPSVDELDDAQHIADFELARRKDPRGLVSEVRLISHAKNGGNQHAQQLARTLGDKIVVQEAQTGHDEPYFIIGELHQLSEAGTKYETTWYVEPAPTTFPWKLGVSGRSELNTTAQLTY